jgi:hypothetical protein
MGPKRTYPTVHTLKGLALPRASFSCEIAQVDSRESRRLQSMLAATPVLFAYAFFTETKIGRIVNTEMNLPGAELSNMATFENKTLVL